MMIETPSSRTRQRRLWLPLVFIAGLLFGWLVIGWWLWPVQWQNGSPAQMAADDQRAYVAAVAEAYALTGDVAQAQARLTAWDRADLAATLGQLIQETTDPQARDRYVALSDALALPQVDLSLMDLILGQKAILITAVVAVCLFLAALGLAVWPSMQQIRTRRQEERQLLAGPGPQTKRYDELETAVASAPEAEPQTNHAASAATDQTTRPVTSTPGQPDTPAPAPSPEAAAAGKPGAVQTGRGQPPQNPANAAAAPPAQAATAVPAPPPGAPPSAPNQPQLLAEPQETILAETTGDIHELLSSIFVEDDKLAHYETLLRGLGDVGMEQLAAQTGQVLRRLRRMNRQAA